MNYLHTIIKKMQIDENDIKESFDMLCRVYKKILEKNIRFSDENFELSFYSHIVGLIKRIKNRNLVQPIDIEIISDVDESAMEFSKYLVEDMFIEKNMKKDISEIFLVATHIQLTLNFGG